MEYLLRLYDRWLEVPRWQKWVLIAIVGVLVFFAFYSLRVVPLKKTLKAEKEQVKTMSLTINKLKAIERSKVNLEKAIGELEGKIAQVEAKLPSGREDVSKIIRSISGAGSGVKIVSIERGSPADKNYYVEVPYIIKLKATYPEFVRWCERLSEASRIFYFGDITLKSITGVKTSSETSSEGKESSVSQAGEDEGYTVFVELQVKAFNLKR